MIASASERSNEGLTSTDKGARRGSLKRAAHSLRAIAGRGVQLRAKFALSSSRLDSRSLHVANSEALPPPAPAAHALLCLADHRVGGRWSRHSRGTPGQKPSTLSWNTCAGSDCFCGNSRWSLGWHAEAAQPEKSVCLPGEGCSAGLEGGAWARPKQGKAAAMIRTPANRVAALEVRRRGHQSDGNALVETRSAL
jgi:hypothetical protein